MKKRANINEIFYHIVISYTGAISVSWRIDKYDDISTKMFETGNYFLTKEEAKSMIKKIYAVFNGADVKIKFS